MKKLYFIIFFIPFQMLAQNFDNYTPIDYGNKPPDHFIFNPYEKAKEYAGKQDILDYESALSYYYQLFSEKQKLLLQGDVYMNDPLTAYINQVCQQIFKKNSEISNQIVIYLTSYPTPNAFSLSDGSVFINTGLLTLLENEAQLAFIIAHEVAHIEKNHSLLSIKKMSDIEKTEVNYSNPEANLFKQLKYSREYENEADAQALRYLMSSDYNADLACKVLLLFNKNLFSDFTEQLDYGKIFKSDSLYIDSNYLSLKIKKNKKDRFLDNKDYDDLLETHPDLEKRIQALQEILKFAEYVSNGKSVWLVKSDYNMIKTQCLFELVAKMARDMNYGMSLYLCLHLKNSYPSSLYIKRYIASNLYWLSYYNEIKNLDEVLKINETNESDEFRRFYSLYTNLGLKMSKQIAYNYIKSEIDNGTHDDDFQYYYALIIEKLLGIEAAKFMFDKYLALYPDGKYALTVKSKLK